MIAIFFSHTNAINYFQVNHLKEGEKAKIVRLEIKGLHNLTFLNWQSLAFFFKQVHGKRSSAALKFTEKKTLWWSSCENLTDLWESFFFF